MAERRVAVFFYGLFMDSQHLRDQGLHPQGECHACVRGQGLRIGQRAALVPDPHQRVYGILMYLTHQEIDQLYSDPSVRVYRPEAVLAEPVEGSAVPALCFNLPEPPALDERNPQYAAKLRELGRRLQLPPDYLGSLQ